MDTTTILPTPPTSGAIVQSSGRGYDYDHALAELITNNNVAETSREILAAIGNSTASIIAAEGVNTVAAINATSQNGVANLKATGDAAVSINKNVYDGTVSTTKSVTDGTVANMNATNLSAVSITKAISDAAAAAAVAAAAAAIAAKDIQISIAEDGCKTREAVAALALQSCKETDEIQREMAKGFADSQYKALENKCSLEAKLAECCCEMKEEAAATRALILAEGQKRLESENSNLRMELLLKNNSNGNGK